MKILEVGAGALTNFEVLELLRSRGAGKDPSRAIASLSTSEFKVFDYLENTVAFNQTRDAVQSFVDKCKKYDLAKAEILNIVNMRPTSEAQLYTIIEQCGSELRMEDEAEEIINTITEILPPHPSQVDEETAEGEEAEEETENPEPKEEETENPEPKEEETENPEPNTT